MGYYSLPKSPDQMATYIARGMRTRCGVVDRKIQCPFCKFSRSLSRGGRAGGAMATVAKLRGMLGEHLREKHQAELTAEFQGLIQRNQPGGSDGR